MRQIDTSQQETHVGEAQGLLVSRRRFLELGVAWAAGIASFVAVGCGGEEDEDEGGEEDED